MRSSAACLEPSSAAPIRIYVRGCEARGQEINQVTKVANGIAGAGGLGIWAASQKPREVVRRAWRRGNQDHSAWLAVEWMEVASKLDTDALLDEGDLCPAVFLLREAVPQETFSDEPHRCPPERSHVRGGARHNVCGIRALASTGRSRRTVISLLHS